MRAKTYQLPNVGVLEPQLEPQKIEECWSLIKAAKSKDITHNDKLAGNITKSLRMDHESKLINTMTQSMIAAYEKAFSKPYQLQVSAPN